MIMAMNLINIFMSDYEQFTFPGPQHPKAYTRA
jgi:hypothetical protein